jgi:CubicO group peptidase (beta-lactamase class C family)
MVITKLSRFILLIISILFAVDNAHAQETMQKKIDDYMTRAHQLGLFSGNVLVADNGKVLYHVAMGFSDATQKTGLTEQYRFHIGSIAKEFDAVAIMMLKEQNRLDLEDKVSKYLPELPAWADSISIKNLLQYTSGLPDVQWKTVKTDADNLADLVKLKNLNSPPGKKYAYNNNNVFLRRRIVEKVSGMAFKRFVEEKILKPSGMNNSLVDPTEPDPLIAKGYDKYFKQDPLTIPISGWTAVTLDDFYKWAQVIADFKLISPASTRAILIPFRPGYQAGLGGGSMDGDKVTGHVHDGTMINHQALLISTPPQGRTVILMTNTKNVSLYNFNTAIQAILDGKPYARPAKSILSTFQNKLDSLNSTQILTFYHILEKNNKEDYGFDDESTLNEIGYYLLGNKRTADAIAIFEFNTKLFPESGNVYDSLGEAYYNQGNKQKALLNYKKSVERNPSNQFAKDMIKKLEE